MKTGRPAKELVVGAEDRVQLESIARSQSLPAVLVRRAQMILRMADGESNSAVARRFRVSRPTVTLCRTRYRERGMAGLHNELKPGRPRSTSEEQIATLINTALSASESNRIGPPGLERTTGLSTTTVHRYLTLFGLQPIAREASSCPPIRSSSRRCAMSWGSTSTRPSTLWCCAWTRRAKSRRWSARNRYCRWAWAMSRALRMIMFDTEPRRYLPRWTLPMAAC